MDRPKGALKPTRKMKRQMRKKSRQFDKLREEGRGTLRKDKKPTGAILSKAEMRKRRRRERQAGLTKKYQAGGPDALSEAKKKKPKSFIESSKEVKFGKVPGAIKRAAKKTVKGNINTRKGQKMLADANTKKDTRKAARTMKKGIRQKKRGAKIKENYEFRQAVKRGEETGNLGPGIGNLKMGGGVDKKFLGGLGRIAGAVKGFRAGKGQGLGARLKGAAKGAAGGGMMGRAFGALKGMRGAAGQGGGLRGMMKAGAQGAMQGAFGGGAQQNAAEAAPAEGMEEEMMYGGMKDRRKMGGCKKGEPCEAYDGGRGPKKPKKRRRKGAGKFKTRVSNIGRRKYENGGDCGPGGCTGENKTSKRNKKYAREAKRAARRRARNRGRGRGRPKV